jgi:hypothetical protein
MSKKIDRALYGPSWTEVILGACLSLLLGVVLAAAYLVTKPVETVREMPKEPIPGQIYLVEGSKDGTKGRQWKAKQLQLSAGTSVNLTEDELNTAVAAWNAPKAKPAGAKEEEKAAEAEKLALGAVNFRIRGGEMQVAVPVTLNVLGLGTTVMVHAIGGFEKDGDQFVFKPSQMFVGSCQVQRLPTVSALIMNKVKATQALPAELGAAWRSLANVTIDGAQLQLEMP